MNANIASTTALSGDSSGRLAEIIGAIDGIAFETSLLALNAAVEAARAGAPGRSVAAVAGEVRTLAGRVTSAASEVRGLIGASVDRAGEGSGQIDGIGETLHELLGGVERVRWLISEIGAASSRVGTTRRGTVSESTRPIDGTARPVSDLVERTARPRGSTAGPIG